MRSLPTSFLSLVTPEFLEQRRFMDVGAGMSYANGGLGPAAAAGTLGIWIDDIGSDRDAFIRRNTDGSITVANSSSFTAANVGAVVGQRPTTAWTGVNAITVFRTNGLAGASITSGGSGYSTAPSVSLTGGTFSSANIATGSATLSLTTGATFTVTGDTNGATNAATVGDPVTLSGGATATVATATAGNITGLTIVSGGLGYASLLSLGISGRTGAVVSGTGSVTGITITNAGQGYATAPSITFSGGGGGSGATAQGVLATTTVLGSFTVDSQANPLCMPLSIGSISFGSGARNVSPANITLTGLANAATIGSGSSAQLPQNVVFQGAIDTSANSAAGITVAANGPVSIQTAVKTAGLSVVTTPVGGDISISGGGITTTGDVTLTANKANISVGGPMSIGGSLTARAISTTSSINIAAATTASSIFAQSGADLEINQEIIANGTGGIQLQSDTGKIKLYADVTANATSGAVSISTPSASLETLAQGVITGQSLSVSEGLASATNYTISANVSNFSAPALRSNVTLSNARSLNIGTGPVNVYGTNLTIATTSGDLTVAGTISSPDATIANISLGAAGNVNIGGDVIAPNRTIAVVAGGSVTATSLLNATGSGGLVDVQAGTGINLGANFRASNLSARTTSGNINASTTGTAALRVLNATTSNTGNVTLQSASGNLDVAGNIATGTGAISLRSTAANVNVLNTATITAAGGTAALRADLGNVAINGTINTLPGGTVSLNAVVGSVTNGSSANVTTGTLNYTAQRSAPLLNTATYSNLAVNLTQAGQNLTLANSGSINLVSVALNNGTADISAMNGLTVSGPINVGTAQNVTLGSANGSITGSGLVTGNVLNVNAKGDVTLSTNVASLTANITGTGNLSITERDGLQINAANVTTSGGLVNITAGYAAPGTLNGAGFVNAAGGNVTLRNTKGAITFTANAQQVVGNVLNVTAQNSSALNTNVNTLVANITNNGSTLTINEANSLTAIGTNVATNNGDISITLATGSLTGTGNIVAGTGNVTLNASQGGITLNTSTGQVSGNVLNVTAKNNTALNTNVSTLVANITNNGSTLTINEANSLTAIGTNVATNNGDISINLATGSLNGFGNIVAGTGNVALNASQGGITLNTSTSQVSGNVLTVRAQNNTALNTNVSTLVANITNNGSTLTINEANSLTAIGTNVATNNGDISINLATGSLNGFGNIVAGTGNVTLVAGQGGIVLNTSAGQVSGNVLTIAAQNSVAVNTSIHTIDAIVTDASATLTVNEWNGLDIKSAQTTGGRLVINAGQQVTGSITGAGLVSATSLGNVTLNAAQGGITLNSLGTQVVANVLTVRAQNAVAINSNAARLNAAITGSGDFILTNGANLAIATGASVLTANGAVTLTAANLVLDGSIQAGPNGSSNVTLNVGAGEITGSGTLNAGNLAWAAVNQASDGGWNYSGLTATVTSAGNGIAINRPQDADLTIYGLTTAGGPINVSLTGLQGNLTFAGNLVAGGNDNVSLAVANGGITSQPGTLLAGNVLNVAARDSVDLATNVSSLIGNISGPSGGLTIREVDSLAVKAGDAVIANGPISINVGTGGAGNFTLNGTLNSVPRANVTIAVPSGSILGNGVLESGNLTWVARSQDPAVSNNWNYTGLNATVTGAGENLSVTNNGSLTIFGLATNSGTITIEPTDDTVATNVDLRGNVVAGQTETGGNAVVININGAINSNGGTIFGKSLNITVAGDSTLSTNVTSLTANVTGAGSTLTINEADDLTIAAAGIINPNGDVNLYAAGDINGTAGTIQAINLDVAANSAILLTNVTSLTGTIWGSGGAGLKVTEADDLSVGAADITSTGDPIALTLTAGNLSGPGTINAAAGDVSLNANSGNITLNTTSSQVSGNNLTVRAQNSSALNTAVNGLTATITNATDTLTIVEANNLAILAGNVTTAGGDISITALTGSGTINGPGVLNAGGGNVALQARDGIFLNTSANQVVANLLNAVATQGSINVNTNINRVSAKAQLGSVFIKDIGDLTITSADEVTATQNNITIQLDGNLSIAGNVTGADGGLVVLNSTGGNITTSGASTFVFADNLDIRAAASSALNTSINSLTAKISGASADLTLNNFYRVDPADPTNATGGNLSIGTGNVTLAGGTLTLTLAANTPASLLGSGSINAGGGNIVISAANGGVTLNSVAGQVTGNVLNVTAQNSSALNTNVSTLIANITNNASTLTINEANSLTAIGTNVATNNGDISINLATGSLTGTGNIVAGTGNVTLNASQGGITLNTATGQVSGNVLNVRAQNNTVLNTNVSTLIANITNPGSTLTINEANSLTAVGTNVATTNGDISINLATGSLNGAGNIVAGTGNVALNASGGAITLNTSTSQVSGNVLNVRAQNNTALNTNVNTLVANITGSGSTLTINEANSLTAIGTNVATNNGDISINLATGSLTGTGNIVAGTGNVTLNTSQGGITLNAAAGQISGNVLTVRAQNNTVLNTNVNTLLANITGSGSTFTVNELNGLDVPGNLTTSNGALTINVASGNLNVSGVISAGTNGNVALNIGNDLNVTGQLSANVLTVVASSTTALNTAIATLNANIKGANAKLVVNDVDGLAIGSGNVRTNNGDINITTRNGGSLARTGAINAGTANVTLTLAGGTSGNGLVTANQASLVAGTSSSLNTTVNSVVANVTGNAQSLAIYQTGRDLTVASGNVRTNNGSLTLDVATPNNLTVLGNVRVGSGTVTLNAAGGAVNASTGQISAATLNVAANSTSTLNTAVGTLNANIGGSGSTLTVIEADDLTIGAGDVRTNNGLITITTQTGGNLVRTGNISAGTANVILNLAGGTSGNGLVTANQVALTSVGSASLNTTVNSVVASVTGSSQPLAIYQIGRDLTVTSSNVRTNNGALTLDVAAPNNLTVLGNVTAGNATVTLNAGGAVNVSTGQIVANTLNVTAGRTSTLNTVVGTLNANITGPGSTLNVTEADNLTIGSGNVRTNNGDITLTTRGGGSLLRNGSINAGAANVTLNIAGGTNGSGVVSANQVALTTGTASTINTAVTSVVANVASGTLTISDADGIAIGSGGVRTLNADISIIAAGGSIDGAGAIAAGTANVALTNTNGSISLANAGNQVNANRLNLSATATSAVNTNVATLSASIGGSNQGLTVGQTTALALGNVSSNNGTLTFNVPGGLSGAGFVNAGTAGIVVLNAVSGSVNLSANSGQVTASLLTLNAQNSSTLNTSANTLNANIAGSGQTLVINEFNGLAAGPAGIATNNGAITLNLAAGSLTGDGAINAGTANVSLTAATGGLSPNGVVSGNVLTLRAQNSSTLSTNVSTLNANVTGSGQSLTVTEANGVAIGTGNIVTNNGNLTINATAGGINGTGRINTGSGNVTLRTPAGNVTLNSAANQITANALTISALNSTAVNTSISSLNAAITGAGSLTVTEADNIAITQARTANGAINFTTSANSTVNISDINAATGTNGNLTVINGNLFLDAPGIRATQTVDLRQAQSVTVLSGGIIAPVVLLPTGQNTVNYLVTSSADAGPGSLRDVITRINAGGGTFNSTILVTSPTTVALNSALPAMTVQMNVQGNKNLTLNGASAGGSTSGFTITSTSLNPSTISGVTFQNFGGAGVDLVGARNISVTGITVTGSTIGFRASGNLTGSGVYSSTFTNNVYGSLLSSAQNLTVGIVGQGNTFTVSGTGFRGASTTGMSVSGTTTGTTVKANSFMGYPTAVSIVAATGLVFGGSSANEFNSISNAITAGIYATGFCTGSSVIKTTFGPGVAATKQYVVSTSRNLNIVR